MLLGNYPVWLKYTRKTRTGLDVSYLHGAEQSRAVKHGERSERGRAGAPSAQLGSASPARGPGTQPAPLGRAAGATRGSPRGSPGRGCQTPRRRDKEPPHRRRPELPAGPQAGSPSGDARRQLLGAEGGRYGGGAAAGPRGSAGGAGRAGRDASSLCFPLAPSPLPRPCASGHRRRRRRAPGRRSEKAD